VSNVNSQVGDIVNPTGDQTGKEVPGGGGGSAGVAHATMLGGANAVTVNSGTTHKVSWLGAVLDVDSWFSAGSPTKITVDRDGVFLIQATVTADVVSGTGTATVEVLVNGSFVIDNYGTAEDTRGSGFPFNQTVSQATRLAIGDYIEIQVQATTSNIDFSGINFFVAFIGT
jgi:hypothetical protein